MQIRALICTLSSWGYSGSLEALLSLWVTQPQPLQVPLSPSRSRAGAGAFAPAVAAGYAKGDEG